VPASGMRGHQAWRVEYGALVDLSFRDIDNPRRGWGVPMPERTPAAAAGRGGTRTTAPVKAPRSSTGRPPAGTAARAAKAATTGLAKTAPAKAAPAKAATTGPAKTAPAKAAPAKAATTGPAKTAPAKAAPAKAATTGPAKTAPTKAAPAKAATTGPVATTTTSRRSPGQHVPAGAGTRANTRVRGGTTVAVAVREGEDPWSRAELDAVRDDLTAEAARMATEVSTLETAIADVLRDGGDGAGDDQADTGSKAFEREQEMILLANSRETMFQTRHALARIEDGSYGTCESCDEAIGKLRLQAFPRATLCVSCKQRQERR